MGLPTFEGEIYRTMDTILTDHKDIIEKTKRTSLTKNVAGYDLWSVRDKDGSMDLTQLFVGSQGTLGIVSEAKIETESYNPNTTLIVADFDDIEKVSLAIEAMNKLGPSSLELVDEHLLNFIDKHNTNQLNDV